MSDDGFAAYSPYSDFEDILYDADHGPDLAEELASHAVHSPIYAEEPGSELFEYHSDWEYYSDDYYDDDPSILKHNPQDGTTVKRPKQTRRGRKRKLADVDDIPDLDLGERAGLRDCIRGTVWAEPVKEKDIVYRSGKAEKVSLLRDWQERFGGSSTQQNDRSKRLKTGTDESWANDMSLADMGLLTARGSRLDEPENNDEAEDDDEGEDEDVNGDGDGAEYAEFEAEVIAAAGDLINESGAVALEMQDNDDSEEGDSEILPLHPPKRSHRSNGPKDLLLSPPTSTESSAVSSSASKLPDGHGKHSTELKRGRGPTPRQSARPNGTDPSIPTEREVSMDSVKTVRKKRKASASPPGDAPSENRPSIATSRSKRLASNVKGNHSGLRDANAQEVAPTRSTRGKKR